MTTVTVHEDTDAADATCFSAIAGRHHSVGRTAGEALDALLAKEGHTVDSSAILIQRFAPDAYFTKAQIDRLRDLLDRRTALTDEERAELHDLVDAELEATIARSEALVSRMH
jgi:hypothetical protein